MASVGDCMVTLAAAPRSSAAAGKPEDEGDPRRHMWPTDSWWGAIAGEMPPHSMVKNRSCRTVATRILSNPTFNLSADVAVLCGEALTIFLIIHKVRDTNKGLLMQDDHMSL